MEVIYHLNMKGLKNILAIFLLLTTVSLNAQVVTTIAGIVDSLGATDSTALNSTFRSPHGLAVDTAGNVYIADRANNSIRVLRPDGRVKTLAGSGTSGYQDGTGTSADFSQPWGLAVTDDGIVYVADTKNNRIRRISKDGVVTTFAGRGDRGYGDGVGVAATFWEPTDIEIDSKGNLFVVDHGSHIIRKITPTGEVSTFAGIKGTQGSANGLGTAASFNFPYGLGIDEDDNIYVADEWNHMIRKIDPNGLVTTLAGDGISGSNDTIAALSRFKYPFDVAVDHNGELFIADGWNYCIRKIDSTGIVSTYAGFPGNTETVDGIGINAAFKTPTGIAFDHENSMIIADAYDYIIRKLVIGDGVTSDATISASDTIIALGDLVQLTIAPSTYNTYELNVNGTWVSSQSSPTFLHDAFIKGDNFVYGRVNGKSITSNAVNIFAYEVPDVDISSDRSFYYEGDLATFTVNPNEFQSYTYYGGTLGDSIMSALSASNTHTTNTLPVGFHQVYCYVTDNDNRSFYSDTILVEIRSLAQPDISIDRDSARINDSILVTVTPDAYDQYYWYLNGQFIDSSSTSNYYITVDSIGTNSIHAQVSYQDSIFTTGTRLLTVLPINYSIQWEVYGKTDTSIICIGDSIQMTIQPAGTYPFYQLNVNNAKVLELTDSTATYLFEEGGVYQLRFLAQDKYGSLIPSNYLNVNVTKLNTSFSMDRTDLNEDNNTVQFTIDSLVSTWSYLWDFGDGDTSIEIDPIHEYTGNGNFNVSLTATNENGCQDSTFKQKAVLYERIGDFFAPSAFTPLDANGNNDIFYIRGVADPMEFSIYDHWGELIFHASQSTDGWDGKYQNEYVPTGTYTYEVRVLNEDGSIKEIKYGKVSLLK